MGGEGLGGAVDDPAVRNLLASPSSTGSDEGFKFLYAYADTVFPRGTLAPLLMWDWSTGDADAIRLTVETTSGSFSWTGTFGRPVILAITGGKFVRHPIPQNVWKAASETAGALLPDGTRDRLTVSRSGVAYGPISQTYTIAPGRLSGIVYYSSYGTQYAKNYTGALGGDGTFGGTTLSIRIGDSSTYPGISPDGALALTAGGKILELPNAATALPTTGLMASNIGTPAFAPNGRLVAFNPMASGTIEKPKQKLYVAAFDPATREFGENILVVDNSGSPAQTRPGWPGFLPDSESLVFQQQVAAGIDGNDNGELHTRKGARANISWTSVTDATKVTPLDQRNGKNANGIYLPKLSTPVSMSCAGDGHEVGNDDPSHAEDVNFNYEPTVSPAPSGGYAWVVFTSRRLYGNLATIPPFCSDPRGVNLVQNITPKKLWVAAIDLSAKPGTDASHPAFYLPAQELLAGNTRGYGVALVVLGAASRSTAATTGCACARRQSFDRTRKPAIRFYGRRRACLRSFSHTLPSASVASAHNDTLLRPVTAIARTTRLMMLRTANEAPTIATLISNSSIFLAAMTFRASLVTPLALRVSEITKIRPSGAACARAMRKSTSSAASASKIVPT